MISPIDFAKEIADKIINNSIFENDGLNWPNWVPDNNLKKLNRQFPLDFYTGSAGIAFFLFKLYETTNNSLYIDVARRSISQFELSKSNSYPGFFNGCYGVYYSNFLITKDLFWLDLILEADANKTIGFDIISGHAGCILILLMVSQDTSISNKYLEKVTNKINVHLSLILKSIGVYQNKVVFKRSNGGVWTGFSHGQNGVEYVLRLLSELYDDEKLSHIADLLLDFEETTFDTNKENYLDLRPTVYHNPDFESLTYNELTHRKEEKSSMYAWCHGLPGISISSLRILNDTPILINRAKRIHLAMNNNLEKLSRSSIDCLCHGGPGNLEYFIDNPNSSVKDKVYLNKMLCQYIENYKKNKEVNNFNGDPVDFSLMNGLAGLGYFFLRMHDPIINPSILAPVSMHDVKGIRKRIAEPKRLSVNYLNQMEFNDSQVFILNNLALIKEFGFSYSMRHFERFENIRSISQDKLKWLIQKDEFKSFYDEDFQEYTNLIIKKNNQVLSKVTIDSLDKTWECNIEQNYVHSCKFNEIYFYSKGGFHTLEISDLENSFFSEINKEISVQKLGELNFDIDIHTLNYIVNLSKIGIIKMTKL